MSITSTDFYTLRNYYQNLVSLPGRNIIRDFYEKFYFYSSAYKIDLCDITLPSSEVDSFTDEEKYKYYEFIHRFIIFLIKIKKLYILEKINIYDDTDTFHLRQFLLCDADEKKYTDMKYSFTPSDITADNYFITSKLDLTKIGPLSNANSLFKADLKPMTTEDKAPLQIGIMGIITGVFKLYKTKTNDFIFINTNKITKYDFELIAAGISKKLGYSATFTFDLTKTLNTPKFIFDFTPTIKDYYQGKDEYDKQVENETHNLNEFKENHAELLKTMTELYKGRPKVMNGGNKGKYELYSNANSVFINYNNKKAYLYESDNKIFILINNKNIYLTKKSLNYNKNLNKYFIKI
jgi:hypothetical protein